MNILNVKEGDKLSVIVRITSDAKIRANSFNTQILAWDDTDLIDDSTLLDDSVIFDDTAELDTLITYLFDGNEPALEDYTGNIALDEHGNIFADEFCTTQPSYDDSVEIDDSYQLDSTHQFDTTDDMDEFIKYLFNITSSAVPITKIQIHNSKKIAAKEFVIGVDG